MAAVESGRWQYDRSSSPVEIKWRSTVQSLSAAFLVPCVMRRIVHLHDCWGVQD
jgi:hypothetical protein